MTQLNRHQPDRPYTIDGVPLQYRTLPVIGDNFIVTSTYNMIVSARLYREVRRGNVPNFVAVNDLYEFCFPDDQVGLSKRTMGAVIIRTVRYNPRKLLGVSRKNEKARVIYAFAHMTELEFGLEWMICTWLRKFLNDKIAPKSCLVSGPDRMDEELSKLVNSSDEEFASIYEEPLWEFRMDEPKWSELAQGMEESVIMPIRHNVDRKPLRSYH
jgi:hypothetical protein